VWLTDVLTRLLSTLNRHIGTLLPHSWAGHLDQMRLHRVSLPDAYGQRQDGQLLFGMVGEERVRVY